MKKLLICIFILLIGLLLSLGFGLYLMEIEDHYGDIQELYYESQSGHLIVNEENSAFGVLSKNWRRVNVISQNDTIDLFNWVYRQDGTSKVSIYKIYDKDLDISFMTFEQIKIMIDKSELLFVVSN